MFKIKILSVGKTKEEWLESAIQEYEKRLSHCVQFEFLWAKDDKHLLNLAQKEPLSILLDPAGLQMTSETFSSYLSHQLEINRSRLAFIIGGPEGIPPALKYTRTLISLSRMTFTHQLVRLILVEQIYRAFEISKGSKYHK